MGVMNGEATPVAIMLLPSGSFLIMGRATHSKTLFWNGNRQAKTRNRASTDCSSRRRSSSRWAISVGLTMDSAGSLSWGAVMFRRLGLHGVGRPRQPLARGGRGAAHLFRRQFLFKLLVEVAQHGTRTPDPQADAARQARQALGAEHHQRQQEDERQLPEASLEHGQALSVGVGAGLGLVDVAVGRLFAV